MQSYGDETRPLAALSLPSRIVIGTAGCAFAVIVAIHLAMMFLHVAPSNTLSKQQGTLIGDYVYPEYEQNWKLFAPNPLQQNIAVQARAQLRTESGESWTTGWTDLTARDGRAIHHNPLPSHTEQNQLRRGWEFYLNSHNAQNRSTGPRGELSERYVRRIVMSAARRRMGRGRQGRAHPGALEDDAGQPAAVEHREDQRKARVPRAALVAGHRRRPARGGDELVTSPTPQQPQGTHQQDTRQPHTPEPRDPRSHRNRGIRHLRGIRQLSRSRKHGSPRPRRTRPILPLTRRPVSSAP